MSKKYIGWPLVAVGLFMLFKMIRVASFGFFRFGSISTSAIIFILLILSAIAMVVKKNKFTTGCVVTSLCLLVISLILGTSFYFAHVTLIDVFLVFVPIIIGIGLIIKDSLENRK